MPLDLTRHWVGYAALAIFFAAYGVAVVEEFTQLRKSKPVVLAAGLVWALIAIVYYQHGMPDTAARALRVFLLEYMELMLFLLVAMSYINAMEERQVFTALQAWMVRKGFSYRQLFWLIGGLSFVFSPVVENLILALLMCAVTMAVGDNNSRFVCLTCIAIVIAVNAGGVLSPFGDITTLLVWRKGLETPQGMVDVQALASLALPTLVNFLLPAAIMHFAVPASHPRTTAEWVTAKRGSKRIILLFLLTIATSLLFQGVLRLPPVVGMLTGLSYLQFFGYYLKKTYQRDYPAYPDEAETDRRLGDPMPYDIFTPIARAEWDTLLFFYGVVLCVGGLGFLGYLAFISEALYQGWGILPANVVLGLLSGLIDNIPLMFAVLNMQPDMALSQWLLVTLAVATGGSLLAIGSAAGVALMGQAAEHYTFFSHLRWTPVITLGFVAGILTHLWMNAGLH